MMSIALVAQSGSIAVSEGSRAHGPPLHAARDEQARFPRPTHPESFRAVRASRRRSALRALCVARAGNRSKIDPTPQPSVLREQVALRKASIVARLMPYAATGPPATASPIASELR